MIPYTQQNTPQAQFIDSKSEFTNMKAVKSTFAKGSNSESIQNPNGTDSIVHQTESESNLFDIHPEDRTYKSNGKSTGKHTNQIRKWTVESLNIILQVTILRSIQYCLTDTM